MRRRLMIMKEHRLRVLGGLVRVYRLGLRRTGELHRASPASSGVIVGSRESVELLHTVSSYCHLRFKAYQ